MTAKRKKTKTPETIIMIRIPDVDSHQDKATLTIQSGELGHIGEFDYKGLTLKANLAEAVAAALLKLAQIEAAPPSNAESVSSDSLPDDVEEDETASEMAENAENPPETAQNPSVSPQTIKADTDDISPDQPAEIAVKPPKKVSVSVVAELSANPSDNQQMALF